MTRHIHAERMLEYAKDAAEDIDLLKDWQYKFKNDADGWSYIVSHPNWHANFDYRRKPKKYEPTPLDQALELEIEAAKIRNLYYMRHGGDYAYSTVYWDRLCQKLMEDRTPAMIEHLTSIGKL